MHEEIPVVRKKRSSKPASEPDSKRPVSGPRRSRRAGRGHLFEHWNVISRRLRTGPRIALFLDFDGTLAPIRSHLAEVKLAASTRRVLTRLARRPDVSVAIVSGRRVADVRKRVKVPGIRYLGLHGWEQETGSPPKTRTQPFMQQLRRQVEANLAGLDGIWVEGKFISLAVHYRGASVAVTRRARAALCRVLAPVRSRIRVMAGKKIWEVLPLEVKGKGAAVRALLAKGPGPALAVYVGDDTTDEAVFEALPRGVTVRVGFSRSTRARYWLRDPGEVLEFLERMEAARA